MNIQRDFPQDTRIQERGGNTSLLVTNNHRDEVTRALKNDNKIDFGAPVSGIEFVDEMPSSLRG